MTDRRCVFIDIDGTLAHHGVAPLEHVEAVRRASANGHTLLLCTGRNRAIVSPDLMAEFDGLVASAGAWVQIGEEVLRDERFEEQLGRRAVEVLQHHQVPFVLESPGALVCTAAAAEQLREQAAPGEDRIDGIGGGMQDLMDAIHLTDDPAAHSFAKISLWGSRVPVEQLAREMGPEVGALPNSISPGAASGELHLRRLDKADGVRLVAERLGFDLAATVAIGDGMNDLGMLRAAGTAIAIHGAPAVVVEAAQGVTVPGPLGHGIVRAFERLGLL